MKYQYAVIIADSDSDETPSYFETFSEAKKAADEIGLEEVREYGEDAAAVGIYKLVATVATVLKPVVTMVDESTNEK